VDADLDTERITLVVGSLIALACAVLLVIGLAGG
jgi:hypothetical protein